jgi:hypothetical protein
MQPHVWLALMRLSRVFRIIYVKVWDPRDFQALRDDVATTFSFLEWELPPMFFDIMTHLTLHVVENWMFVDLYMSGGCTLLNEH